MKIGRVVAWALVGGSVLAALGVLWCWFGTPEPFWIGYAFLEIPSVVLFAICLVAACATFALKKRWTVAIPLVCCVIVAWLFGRPAFGDASRAPEDLRVMTYNILFGSRGMDEVADAIFAQNPDIVCLQECYPYRPEAGALNILRKRFPNHFFLDGGDTIIMSKFRIVEERQYPFPGNEKIRPLLRAIVDVRGTYVCVLNGHFVATRMDLNPGVDGFFRRFRELGDFHLAQIATVIGALPEAKMPTVICGDFNHPPTGKSYRDLVQAGFTDSFSATGRGFGNTLTDAISVKRVDYIWSNTKLVPLRCFVPDLHASDHKPVVAEFAWNKS